ncbi:hypothetical protein BH23PLA1_BH23PLA1_05070 [soil metagenome]
MARCKNSPETVRVKSQLAERLREIRAELFGERGGPELSRKLGLPVRTWYNYELGVTVPAEILLRFVELTGIEPNWLLNGMGPKFRKSVSTPSPSLMDRLDSGTSVTALLRQALHRLEQQATGHLDHQRQGLLLNRQSPVLAAEAQDTVWIRVEDSSGEWVDDGPGPAAIAARRGWLPEARDCRCLRVDDGTMAPVLMPGAFVVYSEAERDVRDLDGRLVVVRSEGRRSVRWLQLAGPIALLRAEESTAPDALSTIHLESESQDFEIRKVLWTCSPHN